MPADKLISFKELDVSNHRVTNKKLKGINKLEKRRIQNVQKTWFRGRNIRK